MTVTAIRAREAGHSRRPPAKAGSGMEQNGLQSGGMKTPSPQQAFDQASAHPLRGPVRAPASTGNRLTAAAIAIAVQAAVILVMVAGWNRPAVVRQPEAVMVHIDIQKKKPVAVPPPPTPAVVRPSEIVAPIPLITIAPATTTMAASPPAAAQVPVPPNAAPVTSPPTPVPPKTNAAATWQGLLLARLEQAKRYPMAAQMHRQQGVASLRFTMDRGGRVLTARIEKSSGHDVLDQEALALVQRAQPLPAPPSEVAGNPIELVVPIEFFLTRRN